MKNQDLLPFICFRNQNAFYNQPPSQPVSRTPSVSNLSSTRTSFSQFESLQTLVHERTDTDMKPIDIEDFNFPISADYIYDCFETYYVKFYNLYEDLNKLEKQVQINMSLEQLKFKTVCNFINTARIREKMIGLSVTFASISFQMFGMNLKNPWRVPDGENYLEGDTQPFTISVTVSVMLFAAMYLFLKMCLWCYMRVPLRKCSSTSRKRTKQYIRLPDEGSDETLSSSLLENQSEL